MIPAALIILMLTQAIPAVNTPARIGEIDGGKLKGDPTRLAWAPDGGSLYLQMSERKGNDVTQHHFVISIADGNPKKVDVAPEWADKYWTWKSAQAAPGRPDFKVELTQEQRTVRATSAPMGGDLARGGGTSVSSAGAGEGTPIGDVTAAAQQSQQVNAIVLKVRGEVVGEFINGPLIPGLTFGWSPQALGLLAYGDRDGKLTLMESSGKKAQVPDTSQALLPAWTDDGAKLAFLERDGRRKYKLSVVSVGK